MNSHPELDALYGNEAPAFTADGGITYGLPFEPADLDALDDANHATDLRNEHHDGSWRDRD